MSFLMAPDFLGTAENPAVPLTSCGSRNVHSVGSMSRRLK